MELYKERVISALVGHEPAMSSSPLQTLSIYDGLSSNVEWLLYREFPELGKQTAFGTGHGNKAKTGRAQTTGLYGSGSSVHQKRDPR